MHLSALAIAHAKIRHRRYLPKSHHFESKLSYLWFDPDQLSIITQRSWLWSHRHYNILMLQEHDFLGMEQGTIRQKIARLLIQREDYVLSATASIRILALPRSLGFRFNSVVFYFIYHETGQLDFILSEITNTPWTERHVYVHDCRKPAHDHPPYKTYQFQFQKIFHVSPFMPMDLRYQWSVSLSAQRNVIHMQLFDRETLQFDATLNFTLENITLPSQQHRYAVFKVFEPFKMVLGIYLNAFRLWKKKIPFHQHPKKAKGHTLR